MKRYAIAAACLVLTAAMLVGCGCTNRNMDNTSEPTVLPTNEEVWETTRPTTGATSVPTTMPTTMATEPTDPSGTIDNGNGPLEDTATATDATVEGRARSVIPSQR